MSFKDVVVSLAIIALAGYLMLRLAAFALARWLAVHQNLTIGQLGLLSVTNVAWQQALTPLQLQSASATLLRNLDSAASASISAALLSSASVPSRCVKSQVRLSVGSIQLKIHWNAFRGRRLAHSTTSATFIASLPTSSLKALHAFTLIIDRVNVTVDVVDTGDSCPTISVPKAPKSSKSARRSQRNTGMFRMLFAMQLKTLLGQFIMYTLVRWLDVLISRLSIRIVTTQPARQQQPRASLPTSPSAPTKQATVEFIQDSLHLSGDLHGSALGAAVEPGSPRGSTMSLATGMSSAIGGSTTAQSTIDVGVTFSPISLIINSIPVVSLPQSSVLTVSFAVTRPVPSFQRPSVDFTISPIAVNAPPALAFWADHKSLFDAIKAAHALARPPSSHANASSLPKPPTLAQRLRKLGVHMHPLIPNVARVKCPRIQIDAPLDLGGTIQGISLVCSFGSAWWDTTAVLTTTEWSVTHAKEVVEKLASFEIDVTIALPDSAPGASNMSGGSSGGSSSIRSREGTANRASLAANALSQKPLVQVEIKAGGLEARVNESLITAVLAHMAATAEAAKTAAVSASLATDPLLSASGATPTTPLLSPAPMSSRSPRSSPFTLPALARRISRHASLNGGSRSRRIAASDGGQEVKPLIPLAAREMLGLVDMEVTVSFHAVDLVVSPIPGVDVCVSADQLGVRICLAAVPMIEVDVSFSLDALCVRVMGGDAEVGTQPKTNFAMWVLASVDILRLDGLITEVDHVPTHVHSATASIPPAVGDTSMLDPWETQRFDVVVEGHAHHPHIALSATQSLAACLARVMVMVKDHHPTSPVSSAPPSRSMSISVDPPSRPLVALHSTAKFTINRLSMSVSGEHRPELPRTMSAEPGIDGSVDCLMITHSGKRILGGGGSLAVLLAVQALEVPAVADSMTGAMDTLHACRVDEMVVELDGVHFRRNQHCDVQPPPRYHGRNSTGATAGCGGGSPNPQQGVDPLLVASRMSFEHKVVDTAVRASSDMYPRLHRNISTSVNVDEELIAVYSIPVHLLVEQLLVLAAIGSAKSPMTPPPEPKRPSITSLTGSIVESQRAQATAGLVSFVSELPDETKLKIQLSDVKAVMERHDNELYAQSNIAFIAVLATQSASTRTAQQAHPSIFLSTPDPHTLPPWRLDPKQFAPLVNVSAIEIVRKPNQEVAATIEQFHVSVPHEYYFKDVIENFATFVKAIKPAKPPAGTTRTATMIYPTMRLEIQTLLFTVNDDPFEARLNQIFRNGKDQQRSRLEREKLLFNKLKTVPDLDHTAFWRELDAFHGREWVRIMSASAKEHMGKLLVLKLTEVDIVVTSPTLPLPTLAANCNLHDKDTPSDAQFDFELARDLSFRFRSMLVRLRDYPLPVIALPPPVDRKQTHMLHGLLILAEPIAPLSSMCQVTVPVSTFGPQPFIHFRKVMSPIKIYSCLTWRLESPMTIHWGPALEAGLADAVRAIDQFTEPSLDPSEPMPWWDKIRWLLHGKLDIEGEALKLHLLGTRNPYYSLFTSDGSHGVVISAHGKRRMLPETFPGLGLPSVKGSGESLPFERPFRLSFSSSSPGLLQCAQLEVAIVRPLINHNAVPRKPTDDIVAIPWDSGPVDKEVVMNLMGEVMLSMDPVFECAGTPPSHHHVFAIAPENVKEGGFHDSFARFRSHRLSLAVHIRCDRTEDPSHFATFAFTPASIDYAIKFVQFNVITKTTPLRRGPLFPLTTPKYASKKLGLFTSRFALRVDLAPLLITLWHKNKAIQRPSDAVGMRAVVERCLIDFHTARFRSTDATNATPPWYIDTTEIDLFGVELRALILSDTRSSDGSGPYATFEQREQVCVRLANSHASLSVKSTPFFWSPKLSYCRNSDVDYGRESTFGRDINRVQLHLLKEYLASDTVAPAAKPAIQHRIRQLEQSDVYHLDQDDFTHTYVIHNCRLLWNVEIRNIVFKFIELQEQAFLLSYYTSNASLRIMRDLRELLDLRDEVEQEQVSVDDARPTVPTPFKPVLESLARRASSGAVLRVSTADLTQTAPGTTKDSQRILAELLDGSGSVFVSEEEVPSKPATSQPPAPSPETTHSTSSRNRAADLVIKSIMIQFINPQIKLCTVPLDDSPDGSCIVTTENTILTQNEIHRRGIMIKTKTEVDISDANFTVSAMRESAQQLGLGAPYLTDSCAGWLPLEFFFPPGSIDPSAASIPTLPQGFCQVVHRAETRLRYQRLNPAISDKGVGDETTQGEDDDCGLENDQNSWQLEFNRFLIWADPLAFCVLFNIFGKLLIYREPTKTRRQEQLDLLMLAAQADDIRVLLDSILQLRSDISQLQLALLYDASVLQDGQVDVDGTQRWIKVLAQLAEMEDQLLVVMDSFKLLSSSSQGRVRGPGGGLARSKSTSRSTSNNNISGSGSGLDSTPNQSRSSNARVIHETVIKATQIEWHMLTLESQSPFVQWMLAGVDFSLLDFSDQSRTFNLSIQQIFGRNMLPNPIYEEVANLFYVPAFYPPPPSATTDIDSITQGGMMPTLPLMIQVCWHELAPVAGISLVGLFELRLSPIKFQMTYELGKHLLNYVFPVKMPARESGSGHGSLAPSTSTLSLAKSASTVGGGGRGGGGGGEGMSAGAGRKRSRGDLQRSGSTDALSQMKTRASRNTTFVRIRMPSVALCISYRGNKEKNIEDIHEFVLTLPTMEYHNKTWTWLEFLTQVRRDVFFAVLSHTGQLVKEKLFSSRRPLPQVPHHLSPHALPTLSVVPSTPSDNPMGFGHFPLMHDSPRATLMPGPPTASRARHSRSASEGGKGGKDGDASGIKSSPSTTSLESSSSAVTSPSTGKRKSQKSPKNKLFGGLMGKKSGSNTDLSEEELKRKMLFG